MPTLDSITVQSTTQLAGQYFAQAVAINMAGNPTGLLFTCLSLPGLVLLTQAAATTTGTQATVGANTIVVASATGILVGQLAVGAGIQPGTTVTAINGTTITLSLPITAALSTTAVNFINSIQNASQGTAVTPNVGPIALSINSNTFIVYMSAEGGYPPYGGYPSGAFSPAVMNVVAFT